MMIYMQCFFVFFVQFFFINTYDVGAHLNCINLSMQFKWGSLNICLYKEVDKKYTGYNLKTMELHDCALIGVYAVIRLNTVYIKKNKNKKKTESQNFGGNINITLNMFDCYVKSKFNILYLQLCIDI